MLENYWVVKKLADEKREELRREFELGRIGREAENSKPSKKSGVKRSLKNLFSHLLP